MTNLPKKILVGGCSFSSGWGFKQEKKDPKIWPNLLGRMLDADVTNVAETGYDNMGIFLKTLAAMSDQQPELVLVQVTDLVRVVISPNTNGHRLVGPCNISNGLVSDDRYREFFKIFSVLNQPYEHWHRFIKIMTVYQNLKVPIFFINGLLNWDKNFFSNQSSSFMKYILDEDNLASDKVCLGQNEVNRSKEKINQSLWINLTESMKQLQIDSVSADDHHPGPSTHELMAGKIFDYLQKQYLDKETAK